MKKSCLVCGKRASTSLGIRLRRSNTDAVWAPNLGAYLCDLHAISGATIEIRYAEALTGVVRVRTLHNGMPVATVNHPIGAKATILQETLL